MDNVIDVVAAVRTWQNKLWVCRRLHDGDSSHNAASFAGSWEFPGGKVEPGEKLGDALKREMAEEFDTRVIVGDYLVAIEAEHLGKRYRVHFFRVFMVGSQAPALKVHSETRWMTASEAASLPHLPSGTEFLRRVIAGDVPALVAFR